MTRLWLDTPRGRFAALEVGRGGDRPVLYLHGFPITPPTARPFLDELAARGCYVLAPWLRGYAPSAKRGPYDLDALVADVLAIARAWRGEGAAVDVIGHDWGATIAYAAATEAPEKIGRVVTMAVPHPLTFLQQLRTPAQAKLSWYMAAFQLPGAGYAAGPGLIDKLWRDWSPGFTLPAAERAALHACLADSMPAPLGYYRAILRPPGAALDRIRRAAKAKISVPTLYLHGADDGCVLPPAPGSVGDVARFSAPYAREVLPGLGHFLQHEAPALLAERCARWFNGTS